MKNIFELKMYVFLCGTLLALFSACGDDSGPSETPKEETPVAEESSSSVSVKKNSSSSGAEEIADVKEGTANKADSIDVSEFDQEGVVVDERNNRTYGVIASGINYWLIDNLNNKKIHQASTCYDYNDTLCFKYGRLYSNVAKGNDICPEGYELPSAEDYRALVASKDDYQLQYGGSCQTQRDAPIVCTGINDTAFYMTSDDSIVAISKKGSLQVFKNDERFVSVRCVKPRTIVDMESDLSGCSEASRYRTIFVLNTYSAYRCDGSEWEKQDSYGGCQNGEKYLHKGKKDTLYVCSKGKWNIAGLEDIGKPCLDENRHQDVFLNDVRYACTDSGWAKLPYPASKLGECYVDLFGTMVLEPDTNMTFVCRNSGLWTKAWARDLYGPCRPEVDQYVVTVNNEKYFCSININGSKRWTESLTTFSWQSEYEHKEYAVLGFCTDERYDEVGIFEDNYYVCSSTNHWAKTDNFRYLPKCDSTRWDSSFFVGHAEYLCNRIIKEWQTAPHVLFDETTDSLACVPQNYGSIYTYKNTYKYICAVNRKDMYDFRSATSIELEYGGCGLDTTYTVMGDTATYVCNKGSWKEEKLDNK